MTLGSYASIRSAARPHLLALREVLPDWQPTARSRSKRAHVVGLGLSWRCQCVSLTLLGSEFVDEPSLWRWRFGRRTSVEITCLRPEISALIPYISASMQGLQCSAPPELSLAFTSPEYGWTAAARGRFFAAHGHDVHCFRQAKMGLVFA